MASLVCKACKEAYGMGRPSYFASDPHCGFKKDGSFDPDNWQCVTLNRLRDYAEESGKWGRFSSRHCDHSVGVVAIPERSSIEEGGEGGFFLVLGWYKNRGRTSSIYVMWETVQPATLADAELALQLLAAK